ncbi:hypothetical protein M0813_19076 [Anaeramoeba flamelloides]|nr:hypothetical protein M0813_19076 [Anaeramoeba flamelloides]
MSTPAETFQKKTSKSKRERRIRLRNRYKTNPETIPKKVCFRGFIYYRSKIHPTSGNYYYRCLNRKDKCTARFTFDPKKCQTKITGAKHIDPEKNCKPSEIVKKTCFAPDIDNIMSKMIEEKNSTSEIFTNLIQYSEKNNTQLTPFLTQKQIKNKITYRIQSQRPESTLEKITGGNELTMEGYTFLQIYQEIPHRIISWSSYESLNIMRSSAHLFVDGTFLTAPKGFSQLIILSVWDTQTNCFVVTNYTLIDSKLEDNYESLFYLLFKKIPNFSPQFITCDFEHALTNSLKKRFPKSKLIHCFFHFTQCLRRKMDSLGNKKNHEFDFLFNKLKEFISLGPKQLIKAWEHIYSQYNTEKFRIFLNYFYKIFFIQHPPVTWNISSFNRDIEKTNAF